MRLSDLLPAASQPRAAAGRYLGSARAHGEPAVRYRAVPAERSPGLQHLRRDQARAEHILAAWTAAHDTKLSVLRLQNVYGPGQSLTNSTRE